MGDTCPATNLDAAFAGAGGKESQSSQLDLEMELEAMFDSDTLDSQQASQQVSSQRATSSSAKPPAPSEGSLEADLELLMEEDMDLGNGASLGATQPGSLQEDDAEERAFWDEPVEESAPRSAPRLGSQHCTDSSGGIFAESPKAPSPRSQGVAQTPNESQQLQLDLEKMMDEGLTSPSVGGKGLTESQELGLTSPPVGESQQLELDLENIMDEGLSQITGDSQSLEHDLEKLMEEDGIASQHLGVAGA